MTAPTTRETADHAELALLAEAATPGPWKACGTIYEHMNCEVRGGAKGEGQAIAQVWDGPNAFRDGQFIAAANPAIVLALLSEIAALRGERDGLKNRVSCLERLGGEQSTRVMEQATRAKDAERQRDELRKALGDIQSMTNADDPESYRSDDREGCLDAVHAIASEALANQGAE